MQNFSVLQLLKLLSAAQAAPSEADKTPPESEAPSEPPAPAAPSEPPQTEKAQSENKNTEAIAEFMQRHESAVNRAKQKK